MIRDGEDSPSRLTGRPVSTDMSGFFAENEEGWFFLHKGGNGTWAPCPKPLEELDEGGLSSLSLWEW